jgi:hypothetical protein
MDRSLVLWFNAIVYAGALYYLGVTHWKAVVVAILVLIATDLWYGRRWLLRIGFVLFIVAIGVWIGAIPPPQTWFGLLDSLVHLRS